MKFCQRHWDELRNKIDDRGLSHLVAKDGRTATRQMQQQVQEREVTRESFDPLMAAHWAIAGNVMKFLDGAGMNPLYLMSGGDEDKVDARYGPKYEGRTWPRCPLCYINLAHEVSCTDSKCTLPKENGYDWMLDRAADDALDTARRLKVVGAAS